MSLLLIALILLVIFAVGGVFVHLLWIGLIIAAVLIVVHFVTQRA
jgi:hypothetical protein